MANLSNDAPSDVSKQHWSIFNMNAIWRDKLARRATYKALDIPEDDVNIATSHKSGMGWKELAVIGATGLGAAGIYGVASKPETNPPAAVAPANPGAKPISGTLRIFTDEGQVIGEQRVE